MARFFLPLLVLVFMASVPLIGHAACNPNVTGSCPVGQACRELAVGNGNYFCVVVGTDTGGTGTGQDTGGTGTGQDTGGTGTGQDTGGTGVSSGGQGLTNPLKNIDSLPKLLKTVLEAIVQIGTIILTLALVYVGFLFVVAQGNEEKIRNAKSALLWTVIGGLILLGASAIGAVIESTVNTLRV